jgi:hypothetical protein
MLFFILMFDDTPVCYSVILYCCLMWISLSMEIQHLSLVIAWLEYLPCARYSNLKLVSRFYLA